MSFLSRPIPSFLPVSLHHTTPYPPRPTEADLVTTSAACDSSPLILHVLIDLRTAYLSARVYAVSNTVQSSPSIRSERSFLGYLSLPPSHTLLSVFAVDFLPRQFDIPSPAIHSIIALCRSFRSPPPRTSHLFAAIVLTDPASSQFSHLELRSNR